MISRVRASERPASGTRHSFRAGHVLYSKLRTYLNKVLVADEEGVCSSEILPLDFRGLVQPGYARFVLMSSMLVYGNVAYAGRVNKNTTPTPTTCYALSKWQADEKIRELADDGFAVATLRPPMIYGKGCKGNYPLLSKIARHAPIFPDYDNERSMLFIENLCEFVSQVIIRSKRGVFFPQNSEYVKTSDMVRAIAQASGHKIFISRLFNFLVPLGKSVKFFRIAERTNKAFASMSYEKNLSDYEFEYRVADFETSINMIEREK